MGFLDAYNIRARLFPAILSIAPAIAFALAMVAASWQELGLPEYIVSGAVGVLFVGCADLARRLGRGAEKRLFVSTGGRPFPTVLRHRDPIISAESKERYINFLSKNLGVEAPTAMVEERHPATADTFYSRCGDWLRERTRDHTKFNILFEENITYGFRRNLYGLKAIGLCLNISVVLLCSCILYYFGKATLPQYGIVFVVAALHAVYFLLVVTKNSVLQASDQYGRQLVLATEIFIDEEKSHTRNS